MPLIAASFRHTPGRIRRARLALVRGFVLAGLLVPVLAVSAVVNSSASAPATAPASLVSPVHDYRLETGELAGACWSAAVPPQWNRRLLLLAHGLRPESAPLFADLTPEAPAYRALLAEGWIVATTSYRRNGLILADALADLEALRDHLAARHGAPDLVLLEGESMGGWIVTALVERAPGQFHGAVAIGAALDVREPGAAGLTLTPQRPLVFLTNQSELAGPRAYVEATVPREVPPVLLRVAREGHVNVNHAERLFALRTLLAWIERGPAALPRPAGGADFFDATHAPAPQPSRVQLDADGRGFVTRVTAIDPIYGNVTLDAQPADFAAIGLARMGYAELSVVAPAASRPPADGVGALRFRLRYGRSFEDVPRGDWVAFIDAEGFTRLARNFGHAAAGAGVTVGSSLQVRRYAHADATLAAPPSR